MVAELKSHVLSRDEKGMFGIPFKRLLAAGMGGVVMFVGVRFLLPWAGMPVGWFTFISLLILSAPRGGLSLATRLWYQGRGWLMIAAATQPATRAAQLADLLELPLHLVKLDGEHIFAPPDQGAEVDWSQWETYAFADELGQGLRLLEDI